MNALVLIEAPLVLGVATVGQQLHSDRLLSSSFLTAKSMEFCHFLLIWWVALAGTSLSVNFAATKQQRFARLVPDSHQYATSHFSM